MQVGCGSIFGDNKNLMMTSSSPYSLKASESNYEGFDERFCYRCRVKPTDPLTAIHISSDGL